MGMQVFDLQLLVGRENIMGDKPRICIESVETFGNNMYVGTNDCFIHHYKMHGEEIGDRMMITAQRQNKKHLGMRKPVIQIKAALPLNQLIINCDSTLLLISMFDLSLATTVSGKVKNIKQFCLNERPASQNPYSVEICVAFHKKKTLQIFHILENQVIPMYEISLSENPRNMDIDERYICVSTDSSYIMVNYETATRQELFSFSDTNGLSKIVARVGASEFLVAAASSLAVFVSTDGTSNRPPIQWSEGVFAAGIVSPFIVALDDEFITVHSMIDQQQKQTLPFQGGISVQNCDGGSVVICTPKDVFILVPVPLQKQLNNLLGNKQVDEALALIHASKRKLKKDRFHTLLRRVQCMAGFVRFQEFEFDEAMQLFNDGALDPRELISLFPGLLSESCNFKRAFPPYHNIAGIMQMCLSDNAQVQSCKEFLSLYLELICDELFAIDVNSDTVPNFVTSSGVDDVEKFISEVLFATLIVFGQLKRTNELQHFIQKKSPHCKLIDTLTQEDTINLISSLKTNGCYHISALLQIQCADIQGAMSTWRSIEMKEVTDESFPGLKYVANQLAENCRELKTFWANAEWILQIDQSAGVSLFTEYNTLPSICPPNNVLLEDDVVNFLHQYPEALRNYLHYLVRERKTQKEKYHTHLVALYLESVLQLNSNEQKNEAVTIIARKKLQEVLDKSDLYRVHLIMGKVQDAELFEEQVILHSKLGEHEKALEILVHKVRNSYAAKDYCLKQGKGDKHFLQQMFQTLLTVYLQDISVTRGNTGSTAAVIALLNEHADDFDPEKILHILPSHWSVAVLSSYLRNSLRLPLHSRKSHLIQYMLTKSQLLLTHRQRNRLHAAPVLMKEGKICPVCNRIISEGPFARYPNGLTVHVHCAKNRHVCPLTGKVFKVLKCPDKPPVNEIYS